MIMHKTVINSTALISPFGDTETTINALFHGKSSVVPTHAFGLSVSLAPFSDLSLRKPARLAEELLKELPNLSRYANSETILIFAAAKGNMESVESISADPKESLLQRQAEDFSKLLGLESCEKLVISNACASGIAAVDTARDYLSSELYKQAVLVGYDLISEFTVSGFNALGAISPTGARPFDAERSGMTLGEGAAVMVLEQRKPVSGDIVITGSATTNDANHRTGPSRDGRGLADAINGALKSSGIHADQIGAVKCHGTATPFNDAMEAKALYTVFKENQPPVVSLKGSIGHLSGAGSLVETVLSTHFLKKKVIPGTFGFVHSDLPEKISVSSEIQQMNKPAITVSAAGFGGLNSALILEEIQ